MGGCAHCGSDRWELLDFGPGAEQELRVCIRCQNTEQRELLAWLDGRATGVLKSAHSEVAWPYGPNVSVQMRIDLLDWAEHHDVKIGDTGCRSGLHWLDKGRCGKQHCGTPPRFYEHTTKWLSRTTGKPSLVLTQPYEISAPSPAQVQALIAPFPSLSAEIGPRGWYGRGTVGVYIWSDWNRTGARGAAW